MVVGLCGVVYINRGDLYRNKKSQNDLFTLNITSSSYLLYITNEATVEVQCSKTEVNNQKRR